MLDSQQILGAIERRLVEAGEEIARSRPRGPLWLDRLRQQISTPGEGLFQRCEASACIAFGAAPSAVKRCDFGGSRDSA